MRTRPIKPGTIKYLNSAIEFFKKQYGLNSLSCKIKFGRFRDEETLTRYYKNIKTLGYYEPALNQIVINGCDYHPRNELIRTLFHELTHYWQHKVVKKLNYVVKFGNQQIDQLFSDQSLIKDYYHAYPIAHQVYYEMTRTDNMAYFFRPHEIEARKVSEELFKEWNKPEYKGK